jgi:hypothetical protein
VACCYRLKIKDRLTFQIPLEYKEFAELFKEELDEDSLLLYKPWDHEIKLKGDEQPKKFKIYPLREDQLETLRKYIDDFTAKGFIRESKSLARYLVFFIPKPDSS